MSLTRFHASAAVFCCLASSAVITAAQAAPADVSSGPSVPRATTAPAQIVLSYPDFSGTQSNVLLQGNAQTPVRLVYGGQLTIEAQMLTGDLVNLIYTLQGDVKLHDLDADVRASSIYINDPGKTATIESVWYHNHPFLMTADEIVATPGRVVAHHAKLTTAPPKSPPVLELRADTVTLLPDSHLVKAHDASLYLFGTPILQTGYASFHTSTGGGNGVGGSGITPNAGQSSRYGPFVSIDVQQQTPFSLRYGALLPSRLNPQAYLYAAQNIIPKPQRKKPASGNSSQLTPLQTIDQLARSTHGPLNYGDPLLFHEFLPDNNPIQLFNRPRTLGLSLTETAAYSMPSSGRLQDNLYVSRLPELGAHLSVPLTPAAPPIVNGDPGSFRSSLRALVVVAHADVSAGVIEEQPTNVDRDRYSGDFKLDTEPYLIARNTVIIPSVTLTGNHYSGTNQPYYYEQGGLAVNHYFSDRTAIGFQYMASDVHGNSPFDFDVLNTSRELDTRLQVGNHSFVVSTLVQYDMVRHSVFDYKISIAPSLPGLIPQITYDFGSRSYGVSLQIEGITF